MIKKNVCALSIALTMLLSAAQSKGQTRPVSIGVNANWEQNLALSAHLGWSRIDIPWDRVNPANGVWNFVDTDNEINYAVSQGQQILGILHYPPQWVGGGTNANIPPLTTTEWSEYVRRVAQRYRGKIAAYEVWNEPDQKSTSKVGIGWGRNIEEPPLYVDFVHTAAIEIRSQAPGTLVVAPVFQSRNTGDGVDNRKQRILQQIQAASYPDGPGYSFIDVVSVHNNAGDTEPSQTMATRLNDENLAYVWNHCPSLRGAPVWVTEYGWRSNAVGESGQREKICNLTKMYTGLSASGTSGLNVWNVTRGFIFNLKDPGSSSCIFRSDNTPKPVVTQYLQLLPYAATQNPAYSGDYPSCSGTTLTALSSSKSLSSSVADVGAAFVALGLLDPRSALPAGYTVVYSERSPDGRSLAVTFGDSKNNTLVIGVSPALPENQNRQTLTDAGMEWTSGALHISVSGLRSGLPQGKSVLRSLAARIDPLLSRACMIESIRADESIVRRLGFSAPAPPPGFTKQSDLLELTAPTKACHPESAADPATFDFTWTFADAAGDIIRAGIYRYDNGSNNSFQDSRSLHWGDAAGNRYWVAAEAPAATAGLEDLLNQVALSMDPSFKH